MIQEANTSLTLQKAKYLLSFKHLLELSISSQIVWDTVLEQGPLALNENSLCSN